MTSGGGPILPAGVPEYGPAAASAAITSGGRGEPLETPLQSLNFPYSHSDSGRQKPNSEQHGAKAGQP